MKFFHLVLFHKEPLDLLDVDVFNLNSGKILSMISLLNCPYCSGIWLFLLNSPHSTLECYPFIFQNFSHFILFYLFPAAWISSISYSISVILLLRPFMFLLSAKLLFVFVISDYNFSFWLSYAIVLCWLSCYHFIKDSLNILNLLTLKSLCGNL